MGESDKSKTKLGHKTIEIFACSASFVLFLVWRMEETKQNETYEKSKSNKRKNSKNR